VRVAGHILGSASIEITTPKSRVVCSGDLGRPDSPSAGQWGTRLLAAFLREPGFSVVAICEPDPTRRSRAVAPSTGYADG
jgi:hypothetical protein